MRILPPNLDVLRRLLSNCLEGKLTNIGPSLDETTGILVPAPHASFDQLIQAPISLQKHRVSVELPGSQGDVCKMVSLLLTIYLDEKQFAEPRAQPSPIPLKGFMQALFGSNLKTISSLRRSSLKQQYVSKRPLTSSSGLRNTSA